MSTQALLALFAHFLSLSIFATGGGMALASDMHRYVVEEHGYLTHTEFVNSIALAQAAPGPNILFVTVMGWQMAGLPGAVVTTMGLSLPALVFPMLISRASRLAQFNRLIQALQRGLGPIALGLMGATCYLLARQAPGPWLGMAFIAVSVALLTLTRLPPVVVIAAAGAAGSVLPW
jgi:chromate transporter